MIKPVCCRYCMSCDPQVELVLTGKEDDTITSRAFVPFSMPVFRYDWECPACGLKYHSYEIKPVTKGGWE